VLSDEVTAAWSKNVKEQLVLLVSLSVWGNVLKNNLLFIFIDNEAAKSCWIAGSAASLVAENMIHRGTILESSLNVPAYYP